MNGELLFVAQMVDRRNVTLTAESPISVNPMVHHGDHSLFAI
jgi:hypothetical protein